MLPLDRCLPGNSRALASHVQHAASHVRHARSAACLLLAALLVACTSPPVVIVDDIAIQPADRHRPPAPTATDGKRILSDRESGAIVKRIERRTSSELLARHLAFVEEHVQRPLVVGNRSRLLVDGPKTHAAMFQAIESARTAVDLETYILEAGDLGERLAALLEARRAQGVAVRVMYDAVGSLNTPKDYFERLKAAGVAVCAFNPINPVESSKGLSLNNRDHRKILVVDRRIAFTGGINISGVYSSGSFGGSRVKADPKKDGWRDTHIELEGPVVEEFQNLFDAAWQSQRCEGVVIAAASPAPRPVGSETMRVIAQDPQAKRNEVYIELLSAIGHSEQRAWLTFGYFVPDPQSVAAIKAAAERGVDVRLVTPSHSDVWLTLYAGRSHYSDMLESGVRIFERRDAVLHAKTVVIDGVWSTVGTSNLDWRSFVHNFEVNVVILGAESALQLEALFERDVAASEEITLDSWRSRGLGSRLKEAFSRLWAYYL